MKTTPATIIIIGTIHHSTSLSSLLRTAQP